MKQLMHKAYPFHDAEDAKEFLRECPTNTRRAGEQLVRNGAVKRIQPLDREGTAFRVQVVAGFNYEVDMFYEKAMGQWTVSCTCPLDGECAHGYAAMYSLVNQDSSLPLEVQFEPGLQEKLREALGRDLKKAEIDYIARIQELYSLCRNMGRTLSGYDLKIFGAQLGIDIWQQLQLWSTFPRNEVDFWQYLAHALKTYGAEIPAFMKALPENPKIAEEVRKLQRKRHIAEWQELLEDLPPLAKAPGAPVDFRLVLDTDRAILEGKWPGAENFERLKRKHIRQIEENLITLSPEAQILSELLLSDNMYYQSAEFPYHQEPSLPSINRALRLPMLESRIVTAEGVPFERPAEPLRWELVPAQDEQEDYQLRLVKSDGSQPDDLILVLGPHPTLYVTRTTIYQGPPNFARFLSGLTHQIPAPALETGPGLKLLEALNLPIPERLAKRMRRVRVVPQVSCQLKPTYPGSDTEMVCISAQIEPSPDHNLTHLGPQGWEQPWNSYGNYTKPKKPKNDLVILDMALADQVASGINELSAKYDYNTKTWRFRSGKNLPEKFIPWLQSLPKEIPVELKGELASLLKDPVKAGVRLECEEAGVDWFDLKVTLDVDKTELTPEELKLLLNARGKYVRIRNKGWHRMEFELTSEEDERLARLGLSPHDFSAEPQRLHVLQLADEAASALLPETQVRQIQRRAGELKTRVTPPIPQNVQAELRPYQVEGFHFLSYLTVNRFGGILADDMGLGKTLQTLTWFAWLREQPDTPKKPVLVVCPKSVMDNWRAEAQRFVPDLRVMLWHGTDGTDLAAKAAETDILVVNYVQFRVLAQALKPIDWLAVILDEAQMIKNPESQTARAARALKADYRLAVTGTPIENRLLDLWSLMAFVMPGVLGNRQQFAKRYDQKDDPLARRRLVARVRPFLLRRTKKQVATELPDRIEEDIFCDLEGEQLTLYRAEFKRAQQMLLQVKTQKDLQQFRFHFLTSLLRLRQICCHPGLYVEKLQSAPSSKLEALIEMLEPLMEEGHKVLVFSQFVTMLDKLRETMKEKEWPFFYLAGDTENRGELIQKFQEAPGGAVFLLSLKAGGFGLNLTAASYVMLFDPWWNPAVESQAIDRTHRIGQTSKVIAYRLLAKNTIEEKIRTLQRQKLSLVEGVLGEDTFAQSLTLEDLQYLFSESSA